MKVENLVLYQIARDRNYKVGNVQILEIIKEIKV